MEYELQATKQRIQDIQTELIRTQKELMDQKRINRELQEKNNPK